MRALIERLEAKPVTIRVFRAARGKVKSLDNANAANMPGVVSYIEWAMDKGMASGGTISEVEVEVTGGFGQYQEFTGGRARMGEDEGKVGRRTGKWGAVSYSFPRGGGWKLKKVIRSVDFTQFAEDWEAKHGERFWMLGGKDQERIFKEAFPGAK